MVSPSLYPNLFVIFSVPCPAEEGSDGAAGPGTQPGPALHGMCDHYPFPLGSSKDVSVDQTQLLREIKLQSLYHPLAGTLFVCSSWVLAIRRRKIVHSKLSAQKKICVVLKTA